MGELQLISFVMILTRVSAFIAFFPLFAAKQLPAMVKAGLTVGLTLFWFGTVPTPDFPVSADGSIPLISVVIAMIGEFGIGLLLAVTLGFLFIPAKIAGAYAGQEVGLSLASISDPSTVDQSTLVTKVFEVIAILLFFGLNVHHFLILFLHTSMNQLTSQISLMNLPTDALVQLINDLPEHGLMILAPVGVVLFLLTIGLAFLNKAAPTLSLFSVGMSLRSGLGIFLMLIFMPTIVRAMAAYFEGLTKQLELLFFG